MARAVAVFMELMKAQGGNFPSTPQDHSPLQLRNLRRMTGQEEGGQAPSFKELGDKWEEDTWRTERERKKNPHFFEDSKIRDSRSYKSSNTTSAWQKPTRLNVHERLGSREASVHSRLTYPKGTEPYPEPSQPRTKTTFTSMRGRSEVPSARHKEKAIMVCTSSPFQS